MKVNLFFYFLSDTFGQDTKEKFFVRIVREPIIVQLSLIATQENITDYL